MNRYSTSDGWVITGGGDRDPICDDFLPTSGRFPISRYPTSDVHGEAGGGPCATILTV